MFDSTCNTPSGDVSREGIGIYKLDVLLILVAKNGIVVY
jgi:hypothetical protein